MQISPALVRTSLLALAGGLLAPALAAAADGEQTKLELDDAAAGQAAEQVGASGGSIVRTIVGLAVVIGVIYGLTWILRQVKQSKASAASGAGLETLATLPLGASHALHLVRAGDEIVLVGTGEHGVTPIRTYTEAEAQAIGLLDGPGLESLADAPDAFGGGGDDDVDARRGRLIDELRKRTVIR